MVFFKGRHVILPLPPSLQTFFMTSTTFYNAMGTSTALWEPSITLWELLQWFWFICYKN